MNDRIELVVAEKEKPAGFSLAILVSAVVHVLIVWLVRSYHPIPPVRSNTPIARYVELIKQNPREFVEAPGAKVDQKPLNAPFSNANRRASMPQPTGDQPTQRPGNGGVYQPPMSSQPRGPQPGAGSPSVQQQAQRAQQQQQQAALTQPTTPSHAPQPPVDTDRLTFRQPTSVQASAAAGSSSPMDWKRAIQQAAVPAANGGGDGLNLDLPNGGEKGFANQGPLSFETQWYDWGDYAQSMVSRIRVNWYAGMPQLIRSGIQGRVTIRFTIQRDGRITDVTMLESSGAPPYDHAAKKAIEQSSPLNPLPKDFPNPYERVTAQFYYNMEIPDR